MLSTNSHLAPGPPDCDWVSGVDVGVIEGGGMVELVRRRGGRSGGGAGQSERENAGKGPRGTGKVPPGEAPGPTVADPGRRVGASARYPRAEGEGHLRVPTASRYSISKRAFGFAAFHSSAKESRTWSNSASRPSRPAFARAAMAGP